MSVTYCKSVVSPGTPVSTSNKTYCHDITEILLKVVLNTIEVINIRKSKDRQHNGHKKGTNNDLLNTTLKTKDRATRTPLETSSCSTSSTCCVTRYHNIFFKDKLDLLGVLLDKLYCSYYKSFFVVNSAQKLGFWGDSTM